MSDIDEFQTSIKAILEQYKARDLEYYDAVFLVNEEMDAFFVSHATDMSDQHRETAFKAYADLQILAYEREDMITREEASGNIYARAVDMFENVRSPEEIDQLLQPYETALDAEPTDTEYTKLWQDEHDDDPGFMGPFSLN